MNDITMLCYKLNYELYNKIKNKKILITVNDNDQELLQKITGEINVNIKQDRKLNNHNYLFRVFDIAIDNNIFEKMIEKKIIEDSYYNILKHKYKSDHEVLLYLCKWFLLPLVECYDLKKNKYYDVQSISFSKKDNIEFLDFRKKCIDWICSVLECGIDNLIN